MFHYLFATSLLCFRLPFSHLLFATCTLGYYTISSRLPLFRYLFITSLLCSRFRLSARLFVTSLCCFFKIFIISLSVCYVIISASIVPSSVCYVTRFQRFIICLLRHCSVASTPPLLFVASL